jgi:hypothetical protein
MRRGPRKDDLYLSLFISMEWRDNIFIRNRDVNNLFVLLIAIGLVAFSAITLTTIQEIMKQW